MRLTGDRAEEIRVTPAGDDAVKRPLIAGKDSASTAVHPTDSPRLFDGMLVNSADRLPAASPGENSERI